ncbi:MAG: hypothetical protein ACTSQE_06365 [Candidatus Heimdallarchaeaceae archaeon]
MSHNLISLLERVKNNLNLQKKPESKISGILVGCENLDQLLFHIRILKNLCAQLIVELPEVTEEVKSIINAETDYFPIVFVETPEKREFTVSNLNLLLNNALYDRVLVSSCKYDLDSSKYNQLSQHDSSLATFMGVEGNLTVDLFYYDRWQNRQIIQLLILNKKERLENLFRLSFHTCLLKLGRTNEIKKMNLENLNKCFHLKKPTNLLFKFRFRDDQPSPDLMVKTLALFHILRKNGSKEEKSMIKFKLQQILQLITIFIKKRYWFLALQLVILLLEDYGKEDYNFPSPWSLEKIKEVGRKALINESQELAIKGVERLRYFSLKDLLDYNLAKEKEKNWIVEEMSNIKEKINRDNIDAPIL